MLKDLLWNTAKATTRHDFHFNLQEKRKLNERASNWLAAKDVKTWSRHAFTLRADFVSLLNNIAESFNFAILPTSNKPIITMMETIRTFLMKSFPVKRDGMLNYHGDICQTIRQKLEKLKEDVVLCIAHMNNNGMLKLIHGKIVRRWLIW